ncbi:MAG: polysaccharide biosynthesis C-terminal domain-containing protein [Siphonobacter sp.]
MGNPRCLTTMGVIKKLASDTALYGVSSILGRVIGYLLIPLHTAVFSSALMEEQITYYSWVAMLNVIYVFGMETTFFRFATREKDRFQEYYNLSISAILILSLICSGTIIAFSPAIASGLGHSGRGQLIIWLAIVMIVDAVTSIPYARIRLEKRPRKFVAIRIANIALNVGLNFYFLWFCRNIHEGHFFPGLKGTWLFNYNPSLGVGYIIFANLVANVATIPMLWSEFKEYSFRWDWRAFKPMWIYAYPILIVGFAGNFNQLFDRLVLKEWLPENFYPNRTSPEALGIYGNVYKLSIFMSLVVQAFRYAAEPFFFSKAEDKNAPEVFADVMKWFIIAAVMIWVGVSLNLDIISVLFLRRPEYWEGLRVVPILLLANLFLGVYYNLTVWFKLSDRTQFGSYLTFLGAMVTLIGNFFLIPILGYMGCAIAFLLSCIAMTLGCYWLGEKYFPIPYQISSALGYILSGGIVIAISSYLTIEDLWISVPFHCLIFVLFLLGALMTERNFLPASLRNKLKFIP